MKSSLRREEFLNQSVIYQKARAKKWKKRLVECKSARHEYRNSLRSIRDDKDLTLAQVRILAANTLDKF